MPIYNEIFEAFRTQQKEIEKAKNLLQNNGYLIYKRMSKISELKDEKYEN